MHKVHCVIPARYESSRLPGKPLIDLHGKPMIVRSWERVRQDVPSEQITVATDDERIMKVCADRGINATMTSRDCKTGTDRAAEVARKRSDVDVWVIAMGDNPLLPSGVIPAVVSGLNENHAAAIGRALIRTQEGRDDVTTQKVVTTASGRLVYISRLPVPWSHDGLGPYHKAVNVFAIWPGALRDYASWRQSQFEIREGLEILRFIEHEKSVNTVQVSGDGWSVDVPGDAARMRKYLEENE